MWHQGPLHVLFLNTRDATMVDFTVLLSLARTVDREQVRVSVATNALEPGEESARAAFESVANLHVTTAHLGRPLTGTQRPSRVLALAANGRALASVARLALWCRQQGVDIVHVTERPRNALLGVLLARLADAACLIHAHTAYYEHDANTLGDWTLKRADAIVGVSAFTADTYRRAGISGRAGVFAVPNAVDTTVFAPTTSAADGEVVRRRLGVPVGVPLVGCVARISRWKDQETLLQALPAIREAIPGAHLVLAGVTASESPDGRGDYRDFLDRRILELGLEQAVTFVGFVPHAEMPQFYGALDVLAHPAIEEPFGLAVVEAMASGVPVVAVAAGGVPEIVRADQDGLLVSVRDPGAMADAIVRIVNHQELADRLAASGRQRVCTSFTPQIQAANMLRVYQRVAALRGTRTQRSLATTPVALESPVKHETVRGPHGHQSRG